jgi:hypothetical protein
LADCITARSQVAKSSNFYAQGSGDTSAELSALAGAGASAGARAGAAKLFARAAAAGSSPALPRAAKLFGGTAGVSAAAASKRASPATLFGGGPAGQAKRQCLPEPPAEALPPPEELEEICEIERASDTEHDDDPSTQIPKTSFDEVTAEAFDSWPLLDVDAFACDATAFRQSAAEEPPAVADFTSLVTRIPESVRKARKLNIIVAGRRRLPQNLD